MQRTVQRDRAGWILRLLSTCSLLFFASFSVAPASLLAQDKDTATDTQKPSKADLAEAYETRPLVLLPGQFSEEAKNNRYKLGHWATANLRVTATNSDTSGQLHAYQVETNGTPSPVPGTRFHANSTRPASLPKGQQKNLEALVFLPKRTAEAKTSTVHVDITTSGGNRVVDANEPVLLLRPYQSHFLLLVRNNDEYGYVKFLNCVHLPTQGVFIPPPFYSVVYPSPEQPIPLSSNALAWTTIAYILWDQILPEEVSAEQAQALIDWLHFGGQLIISGPNSLEKLRGSPLEKYLPATFGEARNLSGKDFVGFNHYWSTRLPNRSESRRDLLIPESAPMLGVELKLTERGSFLPGCENLIAESAVGRGRIVVTAFPLSEKRLQTWPGLSNFFNGALLRRPARRFDRTEDSELSFRWVNDETSIFDPLLASTLRFTSRDLPTPGSANLYRSFPLQTERFNQFDPYKGNSSSTEDEDQVEPKFLLASGPRNLAGDPWHYGGYEADPQSGVGGWNDEVGIAAAARESISLAAGITPPSSQFVLRMLGLYLLCLVPLNWLFFRLIGKVEWAWLAAPLIAIAGAVTIIRLASLDIGFVRSQSQIGLLEIPAGYQRGHLTEYTALYTSLSTEYQIAFADATGLALPFASKSPTGVETTQTIRPVYIERTRGNQLRDFLVQSNSTGMLHNENLLDLGGALQLSETETEGTATKWELTNGSRIELLGAGVVYRTPEGNYRRCWLGELAAGSTAQLDFEEVSEPLLYKPWREQTEYQSVDERCRNFWVSQFGNTGEVELAQLLEMPELKPKANQVMQFLERLLPGKRMTSNLLINFDQFKRVYIQLFRAVDKNRLGLGEIFATLTTSLQLAPGEMRLIARTNDEIGQHQLTPAATQTSQSTIVLAHLKSVPFPLAQSDANDLIDFLGQSDLDLLRESKDDKENEKDK